jgi:outer membrane biosynthesis protein TonB
MKNRVLPVYPKGARTQRVQGRVRLWVVIDERGLMSEVEPITWNSLLVLPALQAAKRLRFRPYFLNAEAVAVEGPITYQFTISANGTGRVSLAPLR